jgi:DNA-binding CsgD family transcriptional regulator/PAS domain-containing protein
LVVVKGGRKASEEDAFGQLLGLVYDAALETGLWTSVIERMADMMGGTGGALIEQDQRDGSGQGVLARADPGAAELYFGYPYDQQALLRVDDAEAFMRNWRPTILTDEDWMPKSQLVRSEYYGQFLRRVDAHSVLMVRLVAKGLRTTSVSLGRALGAEQFGTREIDLARQLQPHLIRAVELGKRLSDAKNLGEELAQFLDGSPHGLILLDADGKVRHVNRTGEGLIGQRDAIFVRAGRLRGATADTTLRLQALIAAAGSRDGVRRTGGSLALPSVSGRLPLSATIAPVGAERLALFQSGRSVMVCITDLETGVRLPAERLRDLFGLTPAEARVALALFEGATLKEAAECLSVSFYTVRWHLAQIFEKTGVSRQSEMMRLMLRSVGPQGA